MARLAVLFACLAVALIGSAPAQAHDASGSMCRASNEVRDPTPNDLDDDCVTDSIDNCYGVANPDQVDSDNDGRGDACQDDDDSDGVLDAQDNCRTIPNPGQENTNGTRYGDACFKDSEVPPDGHIDAEDNCRRMSNPDQANNERDAAGRRVRRRTTTTTARWTCRQLPAERQQGPGRRRRRQDRRRVRPGHLHRAGVRRRASDSSRPRPPTARRRASRSSCRACSARATRAAACRRASVARRRARSAPRLTLSTSTARKLKVKAEIAKGEAALEGAGGTYVFLDFTRAALKRLFRSAAVRATLVLNVADAAGNVTVARKTVRLAK